MPILMRIFGLRLGLGATLAVAGVVQTQVLTMNRFSDALAVTGRLSAGVPVGEVDQIGGSHLGSIFGVCALQKATIAGIWVGFGSTSSRLQVEPEGTVKAPAPTNEVCG